MEQEKKLIKMSVNLSEDVVNILKKMAEERHTTLTEVLRKAIGMEKFVDDIKKENGKILIEDNNGRIREVVFR